jgi:hypothetical protein
MKAAAATPATVTYAWYGRQVKVDLAACHQALCSAVLDLNLGGLPATEAFAKSVKLHPETVRRFFGGVRPVGPTAVNMILRGLNLHADDVIMAVTV